MLLTKLIFFTVGMFAIVKGADWFTDSAVWIAKKTGIPKVIIGATIVSLATTLPEFAVSVYASFSGHPEMSLGNAVGSNIFNIGMILGLTLIIHSYPTTPKIISKKALFMLTAGILALLTSLDGEINQFDGFLLLTVLIGYILFLILHSKKNIVFVEKTEVKGTFKKNLIKFIAGSVLVIIGSRIVVNSGVWLAKYFGVPEIFIALTLVALGTSLPELVTSLTATLKGYQELSIGNIIGANLLNIGWVTSVSAMVNPISISTKNLILDFPFMLAFMGLLLLFGLTKDHLSRLEGMIFLTLYATYITILFGTL
ncbi:hypothetical protein BBF96_08675 [Anoxybacter fermentans]|uniref:Sodium/calcium exchanger membrane region domain-containing protein n=1 Tax=Anoxybacter fermentans TaxID=1323375 RepID=A0A3S9SYW2_9FIRM|nr:calcium/sodium antiporter [Anoxybacter fermentans]AZR73450.1 hypothetical protein BBF96_08675 [Anoxybacter fermentans]